MNHLERTDLKGKKVGLRVDLNVPIENGEILSHERLSAALPSILYILKHTKKLCVITHLGRPKEGEFDIDLSVLPIKKWFEKRLNEEIHLINNFENIPDNVCFMENIRFFNGENDNDKNLSEQIAKAFDVYVMDAFATAHRAAASTLGAIKFSKNACSGLLFSEEIKNLESALKENKQILSIVGGSKISTKLKVIHNLLPNSSAIVVGGGIANTFLKAAGNPIGKSIVEDDMLDKAKELLSTNKIVLPKHVYVAETPQSNKVDLIPIEDVPENQMILDIELNENKISQNEEYIIWNGPLGIFEIDKFSNGTKQLIAFLENSKSKVIAGGGETLFAINKFSDTSKFHYVSTAGGAFLEYLSGNKLPSIEALRLK